jgi:hypothetical protein
MLSIGIRFGVLALACIASCLALLLFDVTTRAFAQSIDPLPETAGALAWYGMQIGPFAVVTMIPMGIMWIWMKRLRREVV